MLVTFAVGLSVAIVALAAYLTIRHQLQSSLDSRCTAGRWSRRRYEPAAVRRQRHPGLHAGRDRHDGRLRVRQRAHRDDRRGEQRQDRPRRPGARGRPRHHLLLPDDLRAQRRLPRRDGPHRLRRGRAGGRPVAGPERGHPGHARSGDADLRPGRGGHGRAGRLGGGPQRPASGTAAHPRRRGHRPHRAARPDPGRGQRRDRPAGPGLQLDADLAVGLPATGSASWSPTPATSCGPR